MQYSFVCFSIKQEYSKPHHRYRREYSFPPVPDLPYEYAESGNIYLRNRYYNSATGRFITEDPAQDGLNWYVYAGNNPVSFVDPWGLTITLSGTEDEMEKSFAQLQALTDDELTYDAETGVVTVAKSASGGKKVQGTKMIADLMANQDFNVKIERVSIENDGCYIYYNDAGATIQMNNWDEEGDNWGYMVSDGKGGSVWEDHADVAYIVLGHELIHAVHHMNGTIASSDRTVYHYTKGELAADIRYDADGNRLNISEEYNTVGLHYIVEYPNSIGGIAIRRISIPWPGTLTENTLRTENGLNERIAY